MKKLIFTLLIATSTGLNAQIMVVNEIETESPENFSTMVTQWMTAIKTTLEIEDAKTYTFAEPGTKKIQFLQFHESLTDMVASRNRQDENQEKIWNTLQSMEPLPEGTVATFNDVTSFRESSVWEFMPELSTTPETWSVLSRAEKDEQFYRRVQYVNVKMNSDRAYEEWNKKMNALDKKLGISYHYAIFKSVYGAKDADYMVMCIDKSQFEYFSNWEKRTEIREKSEEYKALVGELSISQWSIISEFTWNRILELTF